MVLMPRLQQVCKFTSESRKKCKLDSEEAEESHEVKEVRIPSEDRKSLRANGQKDKSNSSSSYILQAPKLKSSQSENKPEVMDVDPSPSTKQDSNGNKVLLKDYVIINKNEETSSTLSSSI